MYIPKVIKGIGLSGYLLRPPHSKRLQLSSRKSPARTDARDLVAFRVEALGCRAGFREFRF